MGMSAARADDSAGSKGVPSLVVMLTLCNAETWTKTCSITCISVPYDMISTERRLTMCALRQGNSTASVTDFRAGQQVNVESVAAVCCKTSLAAFVRERLGRERIKVREESVGHWRSRNGGTRSRAILNRYQNQYGEVY